MPMGVGLRALYFELLTVGPFAILTALDRLLRSLV